MMISKKQQLWSAWFVHKYFSVVNTFFVHFQGTPEDELILERIHKFSVGIGDAITTSELINMWPYLYKVTLDNLFLFTVGDLFHIFIFTFD